MKSDNLTAQQIYDKAMEQEQWQKQAYGFTEKQLDECIAGILPVYGGPMMAMSWLSDAQDAIAVDRYEEARQVLNRAKYLIDEHWNDRAFQDMKEAMQAIVDGEDGAIEKGAAVLARLKARKA